MRKFWLITTGRYTTGLKVASSNPCVFETFATCCESASDYFITLCTQEAKNRKKKSDRGFEIQYVLISVLEITESEFNELSELDYCAPL
jgi:hypothetical protein